ncbi:MAG: hypothetical protein IJ641_07440 [Lachnospiraceae bacterium]|nr:hypothetical protein [Lachnospiraceae bacterium]
MRFNRKNPKFITDLATLVFAVAVIVLTIVVLIGGSDMLLAVVFYAGAGMFTMNVIRGLISGRYMSVAFIIPVVICISGGLIAQGIIQPWIF